MDRHCRLNPAREAAEHLDDPKVQEAFTSLAANIGSAIENLEHVLARHQTAIGRRGHRPQLVTKPRRESLIGSLGIVRYSTADRLVKPPGSAGTRTAPLGCSHRPGTSVGITALARAITTQSSARLSDTRATPALNSCHRSAWLKNYFGRCSGFFVALEVRTDNSLRCETTRCPVEGVPQADHGGRSGLGTSLTELYGVGPSWPVRSSATPAISVGSPPATSSPLMPVWLPSSIHRVAGSSIG